MSGDEYQQLFDSLVARHGGLASLSPVDLEIVSVVCRLLITIRTADPNEMTRTADVISKLQATLPLATLAEYQPVDLTRLNVDELGELQRLLARARGEVEPPPEPSPEPEPGPAEIVARDLGRWIDERADGWLHRRPDEAEQQSLRNGFMAMGRGLFIPYALWAKMHEAETQEAVENAVRGTLELIGRGDVKVLPNPSGRALEDDCEGLSPVSIHDNPLAPLRSGA